MTTTERSLSSRPEFVPSASAGRLTVVGIADEDRDAGATKWAMAQTQGADVVHLVHAYVPISIPECSWSPVVTSRDARRTAARLLLARALQRVRAVHGSIEVDGSVVAGAAADVLREFSAVVQLVVVSEDRAHSASNRRTAQILAHSSQCPIVVVHPGFQVQSSIVDRPVTMMIDTEVVPLATLTFARAEAARLNTSLCVAQSWSTLHESGPITAEVLAERQQQLDAQLTSPSRGPQPHGVFSELLLDDLDDTVIRLRSSSALLVVASTSSKVDHFTSTSSPECCPVAIVPETRGVPVSGG